MKIIITADTHFGITSVQSLEKMAKQIAVQEPDAIIIAGDIAESLSGPKKFSKCLKLFRRFINCPILIILGNHDLYAHGDAPHNSLQLWETILKNKAKKIDDIIWLEDDNYIIDDVAIVGSYLHYDYSVKCKMGPTSGLTPAFFIHNKPEVIADGKFHHGLPSDIAFSRQIGEAFKFRLQVAQENPIVKHIIVATHVPCLDSLVTYKNQDYSWAICTPYFGNITYEKDILKCSKVEHVVSAHSHQGYYHKIQRNGMNSVNAHCLDSDYYYPTFLTIEV